MSEENTGNELLQELSDGTISWEEYEAKEDEYARKMRDARFAASAEKLDLAPEETGSKFSIGFTLGNPSKKTEDIGIEMIAYILFRDAAYEIPVDEMVGEMALLKTENSSSVNNFHKIVYHTYKRLKQEGKLDNLRIWPKIITGDVHMQGGATLSVSGEVITAARKLARRTAPLPDFMQYGSTPIHNMAVLALCRVPEWGDTGISDFSRGMLQEGKNFQLTIGIPNGDNAETLWQFLCKGGPQTIKAHYALWARWYEEGETSGEEIVVQINQFCEDMGYKKKSHGGYSLEQKQNALHILEGLTSTEIRALWSVPGPKQGTVKDKRLRGKLWNSGIIADERIRYGDLFGPVQEGDPSSWEPVSFSYRPGDFFRNVEFRKYYHAVGKLAIGLMKLRSDRDEWAIYIGGYFGTFARTVRYRPKRLRIGTILQRTNLAQTPDEIRRVSRCRDRFERALDRLAEVGVITSWKPLAEEVKDIDDTDDPETIAAYYATEPGKEIPWRAQRVEITFPNEETDGERLDAAQKKAIAAARRKRTARKKKQRED